MAFRGAGVVVRAALCFHLAPRPGRGLRDPPWSPECCMCHGPPTAPAVSPVDTLSRRVQHCPLPVSPVRDRGALLTLSGAAALSSPPGAPRGRGRSRGAQQWGTGGRWRARSQTPSPNRSSRRGAPCGGPGGTEGQAAAQPRGRYAARTQPVEGGRVWGRPGAAPPGGDREAQEPPCRGRRDCGAAGNAGETGAGGEQPGVPRQRGAGQHRDRRSSFPSGHRAYGAETCGHRGSTAGHLRARPGPPCSVRNRARPVPPRPGSGSERSDAVRCGAGSGVFGSVRAAAGRGATRNCPGFSCPSRRGAGPERARRGAARGPRPGIGSAFGGGGDFAVTGGGCHLPRGFPTCRRPIKADGSAGGRTDPIGPARPWPRSAASCSRSACRRCCCRPRSRSRLRAPTGPPAGTSPSGCRGCWGQ